MQEHLDDHLSETKVPEEPVIYERLPKYPQNLRTCTGDLLVEMAQAISLLLSVGLHTGL